MSSKVMNLVNKVGNAILMNLMFLISCIPVVTIGAAWNGMYSAVRFTIRKEHWFAGFKEGFKTEFKRTTMVWIASLLMIYLTLDQFLYYLEYLLGGYGTEVIAYVHVFISGVCLLITLLFLAAFLPVNLYIRTDSKQCLKNTLDMILHAPLEVLAVAVLMWAPVVVMLFFTDLAVMLIMLFIAAYYSVAIVAMTVFLKKPLVRILQLQRARDGEQQGE